MEVVHRHCASPAIRQAGRLACVAALAATLAVSLGSGAARADTLHLLTEDNRPLSFALGGDEPSGLGGPNGPRGPRGPSRRSGGTGSPAGTGVMGGTSGPGVTGVTGVTAGPGNTAGPAGGIGGVCAEVVQAMAQLLGVAPQVTLMPWARAFERAQKDENTGLFCTARTPEREALFQWVGPLLAVEAAFYARRDSGQRLASLDEARTASTILVVRSFFTHQFLQAQGFANLHSVSRPEDMLRMLMNDRAPLMFANKLTVPELAAQQGVPLADLVPLRSVLRVDEYLAFSPRTPPQVVARWAAALAMLKRDGTLGRILARWNAGD
jgi:polar amino acid transport system substrate-binding protein